jgi:heme exporter protein B
MTVQVCSGFRFQVLTVLQTSARSFWARKSAWFGVLIFGVCLLVLFPFSFGTDLIKGEAVRIGTFWMIQEFLVALVITRIFAHETEHGAIELFLQPRFSKVALIAGKVLFTVFQLLTLQLPLFVVWWALYELPVDQTRALVQVLLPAVVLFDIGTAVLGVMLNALTARSLGREILVPILFFPLQIAMLLAAVQLTMLDPLLIPKGGFTTAAWWTILGGFPVILGCVAVLLQSALFEE